ncbi:hypothetical protein [Actinocrispum wychmicini]|uniref:Uncharacterized protein n=1 Tax=Actinocrispum wychmicini TaxID=1213861 RepID=A0A4R2JRH9_9PSEU|nr:hypothetical protein [Actinocrispum wychmicini]TCO59449.1 hypothetical protein EV192_104291 [Actinocrispum wychmicini]
MISHGMRAEQALRLAELTRELPDQHATRDERADWFEKKAEFFESVATKLGLEDQEEALKIASDSRELAQALRARAVG